MELKYISKILVCTPIEDVVLVLNFYLLGTYTKRFFFVIQCRRSILQQ